MVQIEIFPFQLLLGISMGMYPMWTLVFVEIVLKLKWSFKAEHRDKLTYLKNNKGDVYNKCDRLAPILGCPPSTFFKPEILPSLYIHIYINILHS